MNKFLLLVDLLRIAKVLNINMVDLFDLKNNFQNSKPKSFIINTI